jgi:small neutral amino acid transporter SnatA (MarC family)
MQWFSLAGVTFVALLPLVNPFGALPLFASLTQSYTPSQRRSQAMRAALFAFLVLFVTEFIGNSMLHLFGLSLGMLQIAGGLIVANTAWSMSTGAPRVSPHAERELRRRGLSEWKASTVAAVSQAASAVADAAHTTSAAILELPQRVTSSHEDPDEPQRGGDEPEDDPPEASEVDPSEAEPTQSAAPPPKVPDISFTPMTIPMLTGPGSMGIVIGLVAQYHGVMDWIGITIGIAGMALLSLLCLLATTPINRALGPGGILAMQRIFGFITLGIAVALVSTGIASLFGLTLHGIDG